MTKVNSGNDMQAAQMGGDVAGYTGTSTSTPTGTTLTDSGATWTTNQWAGHMVTAHTGVYGVVVSNTSTVLTIDRWYAPASPGGAAGTTPGATGIYVILPGNAPAWYHAVTADAGAPAAGDTTLASEITTAAGGLKRKLATYAHTGGAASYSLTTVFTANGSDSLPVTLAKMGTFNSVVPATGKMIYESAISPTATLSASGDQLTLTQTVTN